MTRYELEDISVTTIGISTPEVRTITFQSIEEIIWKPLSFSKEHPWNVHDAYEGWEWEDWRNDREYIGYKIQTSCGFLPIKPHITARKLVKAKKILPHVKIKTMSGGNYHFIFNTNTKAKSMYDGVMDALKRQGRY